MLSQTSFLARSLLPHGRSGTVVTIPEAVRTDLGGLEPTDDVDLGYLQETGELVVFFDGVPESFGGAEFRDRSVLAHGEAGIAIGIPADVRRDLGGFGTVDGVDLDYRDDDQELGVRFRD